MNSEYIHHRRSRHDSQVLFSSTQRTMENYQRTFVILKSQKTILMTINQQIQQSLESSSTSDKAVLEFVLNIVIKILKSDFNNLFSNASNALVALQSVVKKGFNSQNTNKYINGCFNALITLVKLPSLIVDNDGGSPEISRMTSTKSQPLIDCSQDGHTTFCRLCNEAIPTELFSIHMKSCSEAYRAQEKIEAIETEAKKLNYMIGKKILTCGWPGDKEITMKYIFPMTAVKIVLEQALSVDPSNSDSYTSLVQVNRSLNCIQCSTKHQQFLVQAKFLMKELIKRSLSLTNATNIMSSTRKSGSKQMGEKITIASFDFIKRISAGAYARVFLGKNKKSGDIYAIKVTKKSSLHQKNDLQRVLDEKDILLQYNCPNIVNFYYSFVGRNNLYLVMEFLPGGDLYSILQNVGCFDELDAKIYAFQLLEALNYLHKNKIIHRDLKPDNLLIAADGTLRLTDFGLSYAGFLNRQSEESKEMIGTPDYMAPEIILNYSHSYTADYWSFGIILYEFLLGSPPFHAETEIDTYRNIITGKIDFSDTDDLTRESLDLISKLLVADPKKRLGANGIEEIYNHPWFKGFNIKEHNPPFKPDLKSKEDCGYFEQRYLFKAEDDFDIQEDININYQESNDELKSFGSVSISRLIEKNESIAQEIANDGRPSENIQEIQHQESSRNMFMGNKNHFNYQFETQKFDMPFNTMARNRPVIGNLVRIDKGRKIMRRCERKPLNNLQAAACK
ncbi:AGC family protein kinase [Tritrichomonas foetus]|uniref:non-specific serine/threonine protein kinase n=1 Tax=Tritrichomonas foetus TaxID=1144522 RepID=A0A1J4J0T4_9EUKA|nr:AGC family protein kinase [Tritrichomonas foetus]|eukprot:OHS93238.1 AGC family protein kinase [Tritrichomonas foetus]